jgi:hypothetical protein
VGQNSVQTPGQDSAQFNKPMKRALLLIGMLLLFNAVAVGETYTGSKALTQ